MTTNADITIFNKWYNRETRLDEWKRTQIRGVNWYGGQAVAVTDNGLQSADTYTVRIPAASAPQGKQFVLPENYASADSAALTDLWTLQSGDIVVRGLVDDTPAGDTDITQKYNDRCFMVTGWRDNRRGGSLVQHWRVDGA